MRDPTVANLLPVQQLLLTLFCFCFSPGLPISINARKVCKYQSSNQKQYKWTDRQHQPHQEKIEDTKGVIRSRKKGQTTQRSK